MAILEILHYPDVRLHIKANEVTEFDDSLQQLIDDMAQTMYANNGIGLAATQVNVHKRIFIMDVAKDGKPRNLEVFINPKILNKTGETKYEEGCLSVPGIYETVNRAHTIDIEYQDIKGNIHCETYEGIKSICIQHETDHLDGKVFVEYLSNLKQTFIKKKLKKANKN